MSLIERLKSHAVELGFDLVGIAPAGVAPHAGEYANWVTAGMAGEMAYMTRDPDRRGDVQRVLPGAQSVIVVGLSYYTVELPDEVQRDPSRGLIARYAWGVDYHVVMAPRLQELAQFVREETRGEVVAHSLSTELPKRADPTTRIYVDTGAVLERDWAQLAGLGFIGKNTCLIHPHMGSWLFLGVVITDLDLDVEQDSSWQALLPAESRIGSSRPSTPLRAAQRTLRGATGSIGCGSCTRCLTACPTDAFAAPYVLDARKCISYLTIELRGSIPVELRPLMGNRIFGCDICQEVCPWPARFATPTKERSFYPVDLDHAAPKLVDLALLTEENFRQRFAGTPVLRSKRRGLLRNVAVALGNWGSDEAREALHMLANDPDPLIAEHAQWGLTKVAYNQ